MSDLDRMFNKLAMSKYRRRFGLKDRELRFIDRRGLDTVREHAYEFVCERVAGREPEKDGRQTPAKNHPVFVAQHATGTCCRKCLNKSHRIELGRPLSEAEIDYVVYVIMAWIERDLERVATGQEIGENLPPLEEEEEEERPSRPRKSYGYRHNKRNSQSNDRQPRSNESRRQMTRSRN